MEVKAGSYKRPKARDRERMPDTRVLSGDPKFRRAGRAGGKW
jgi:hypothetical protein